MEQEGFSPYDVRRALNPLPFGSLAAAAYEQLYGAGQWYRQNVADPTTQYLQQYQNRGSYSDWPSQGLQVFQNAPTGIAIGLTNIPTIGIEAAAATAAGAPMLATEMRQNPAVFVTRAGQGLGMQYQYIREGITTRPAEFAGEMAGMILLTHGAGKAAGAAAKASPIKIRTAEIPTGEMRANPSAIPESVFKAIGKEKPSEVPATSRYTMVTVEPPGVGATAGRVVAGVARTEAGTQVFRGHPATIMEKTPIAIKAPLDVTNPRPWSQGEAILMREHMARTATPEAATLVNEGQVITQNIQNRGIRATVDQQVQPFELNLETFGGPGSAGNRAIVQVLSQEKYRGRVVTGGSIAQKAYVPEGAYRDVSFSDVDIWVKDAATGRELYTDLTAALEKTGAINYEPVALGGGKFAQTHIARSGSFEILGTKEGVRGIGAHTFEQFPQVAGQGRIVKTVYGGEMEIANPVYNLRSKMSGAFKGITYKPGGKTELLVYRAKDLPDISVYSRQAAANLYDREILVDVMGRRSAKTEAAAGSYERVSAAARKYGLELEKTRQGLRPEDPKNLRPDEIGTGITIGEKVKKTFTREITKDVLKGNPRQVRPGIDILGIRGGPGGPRRRGFGDDAVLLPGRRTVPGVARDTFRDIYPAGRSEYPAGSRKVRGYPAALAAATRYPKGVPGRNYPRGTAAKGYPAENYPARTKGGGGSYPVKGTGKDGYTPGGSQYTGRGTTGYMGPPPYPKGPDVLNYPPYTEMPRERTRALTPIIIPIGRKKRKGDEDQIITYRDPIRDTFPYLEEAPVASHYELLKGITNAKRRRRGPKI